MAVVKMTRVFIAGPVDNRDETVRFLQEVGVLHVEPATDMSGEFGEENSELLGKAKDLKKMIADLKKYKKRETATEVTVPDDELTAYAEERLTAVSEMRSRKETLERMKDDLSTWGNFDLDKIRELEESGVYVRRFSTDKKLNEFEPPEDLYLEVVPSKRKLYFFTVSIGAPKEIPDAQELSWPELNLDGVEAELKEISVRMEEASDELAGVFKRVDVIKNELIAAMNEAGYMGNMATLYEEQFLFALQGWIPEEKEGEFLKDMADSELPLQVSTRAPDDEEEPPVMLRNNWFVNSIEPLLRLYGLPRYREIDPSAFFAPFMVLFFGICTGDAGYGLLFLVVSWLIGKKWGEKKEGLMLVVRLCELFSVASIMVGLITGSIFGITFKNRDWILLNIDVQPETGGNPMLLLYICIGIGVVHLSVAYILGIHESPHFHEKMEKLGTLFILWGVISLIVYFMWFDHTSSMFNGPLLYGGLIFAAAGVLIMLLLSSDSKKWYGRLGLGLWNLYGSATGLVGDTLSYARLFGLGIATVAVAAVMNQLAGSAYSGLGPAIGGVLAVVILIVGHVFNFALCLLGSTIHSARLHFVETFPNFYEGGGEEYKPFKIERGS